MCTGRIPVVFSVSASPADSGVMLSVTGSMSQNTGVAPSYRRQFADATKLNGVVTTSSPGCMPAARIAR